MTLLKVMLAQGHDENVFTIVLSKLESQEISNIFLISVSFQPLYPIGICNCHLDLCLSTVFDFAPKCPSCAEYEEPQTTTPFDWNILFQGTARPIDFE